MSLLPVLPIFAARPLEATTPVRRSLVVIPAVVFIVTVVTPTLFLLLFFFLGIVVILVEPILSVLVPTPIRVFGPFMMASLVVSAWGSLGLHASYYGRCRENPSLCADCEAEPPGFWTRRIQCLNVQHKQDLYIRHIREINHSGFQIEDSLYYINHDTTGKIYKRSLFERKDSTSK